MKIGVNSPRIKLRLTRSPLSEDERLAGEGTLDQVRMDFERLEFVRADYILLDTYGGNPEQTRKPERAWRMPATLAEKVVDLERGGLR